MPDCHVTNCDVCSAPNTCQTCKSGYYLHPTNHNCVTANLSLTISGGSNLWQKAPTNATITATATNLPLLKGYYRFNQPYLNANSCTSGESLDINNSTSPYTATANLANIPSSEGIHTLYACALQDTSNLFASASANFLLDTTALVCQFNTGTGRSKNQTVGVFQLLSVT